MATGELEGSEKGKYPIISWNNFVKMEERREVRKPSFLNLHFAIKSIHSFRKEKKDSSFSWQNLTKLRELASIILGEKKNPYKSSKESQKTILEISNIS